MDRYKSLEEFKSEFGDYRVNRKTRNVCEEGYPISEDMVHNDPFTCQEEGMMPGMKTSGMH